jgi:hypothetical protein
MKMLIHIGGNKTASTLLQRRLFAKHPEIKYLGEDCENYSNLRPMLNSLVSDDDSHFDFTQAKEIFAERFAPSDKVATCVYSNEDIMTSPLPSVCAVRLKEIMPEAEIVMVIRNQLTTWPSWYANHGAYLKGVPRRYWRKHVTLDEWLEYCFSFPNQTPVEAMNYDRFYRIFCEKFGAKRMRVLLYEELVADPVAYYRQWADMLGISHQSVQECVSNHVERTRNSARRMQYDQWSSRFFWIFGLASPQTRILSSLKGVSTWLDAGPAATVDLPDAWIAQISDYYSEGNSQLAERTKLDLRRYGYPLG